MDLLALDCYIFKIIPDNQRKLILLTKFKHEINNLRTDLLRRPIYYLKLNFHSELIQLMVIFLLREHQIKKI